MLSLRRVVYAWFFAPEFASALKSSLLLSCANSPAADAFAVRRRAAPPPLCVLFAHARCGAWQVGLGLRALFLRAQVLAEETAPHACMRGPFFASRFLLLRTARGSQAGGASALALRDVPLHNEELPLPEPSLDADVNDAPPPPPPAAAAALPRSASKRSVASSGGASAKAALAKATVQTRTRSSGALTRAPSGVLARRTSTPSALGRKRLPASTSTDSVASATRRAGSAGRAGAARPPTLVRAQSGGATRKKKSLDAAAPPSSPSLGLLRSRSLVSEQALATRLGAGCAGCAHGARAFAADAAEVCGARRFSRGVLDTLFFVLLNDVGKLYTLQVRARAPAVSLPGACAV